MRTRAPVYGTWTSAAFYLAARLLAASEVMPEPIPGPDYVVERVTALPQVTIRASTQTRDGYLWIGTYKGLIRFDGVRSVTFDLANTPGLSSDGVSLLYEDSLGDLWIGTDDGGEKKKGSVLTIDTFHPFSASAPGSLKRASMPPS